MNWLAPFLTPAAFMELGIVILVFVYLFLRFKVQNDQLISLGIDLQLEKDALQQAQKAIEESRAAGENAQGRVTRLNGVLTRNSMVWKRAQLTARNRSRRPEANLPQKFFDVTEEARYWQGAFVFIGLAGTLVCLGLAVAYLTMLVGRNASETSMASGLKEVVSHMTAVFGGMGAAFLSTACGVGFTLTLAGKVNVQERGWEQLRNHLEEFSLLEIEPLAAQMMEKTEDIPRLEAVVARMDGIASNFNSGLLTTLESVKSTRDSIRSLLQTNEAISKNLSESADKIGTVASGFSSSAGDLAHNLETLQTTLYTHGETLGGATRQWNQAGQNSLELLRKSVDTATQTFVDLSDLRRDMVAETNKTYSALLDSTNATQGLAREMQASAFALGSDIKTSNQSSLSVLREEIARGLLRIADSIDGGVHNEKLLLDQFRLILEGMGEYAMRVEETLHQLPVSIGNDPLFLVENNSDKGMLRVEEGIASTNSELQALRRELREALVQDLSKAIVEGLQQSQSGTTGVGKSLESLRGEIRSSHESTQKLQENLSGLENKVSSLNSQMAQMKSSTTKLDKGIMISWPWGRS